jgi:hypothetical protein
MEEGSHSGLSSTVMQVIDEFVAEMREDTAIDAAAVDRLEELLERRTVPRLEDVADAIVGPPRNRES